MIIDRATNTVVTPTIFPDNTSQVWKLPTLELTDVWWFFEEEAEIMWMLQLLALCEKSIEHVVIPFMPYARQDKSVSNEATFAFWVFFNEILSGHFPPVYTFDLHCEVRDRHIINIAPDPFIVKAFMASGADLILFPDSGAEIRASMDVRVHPHVTLNKARDPLTGHIDHVRCPVDLSGKHVLMVDDICDGGATFLRAAGAAYNAGASEVSLYVSHGLFTKGITRLREAGISQIYTTNSTLNHFDVTEIFDITPLVESEVKCVYR